MIMYFVIVNLVDNKISNFLFNIYFFTVNFFIPHRFQNLTLLAQDRPDLWDYFIYHK